MEIFEVLSVLRELNAKRPIYWELNEGGLTLDVRIPIDLDEMQFTRDMQRMFAPKEG